MSLLVTPLIRKNPNLKLFCFPHAGGGASTYYSWSKFAPEWLEISAIQLPGHETRISEPLVKDWSKLIRSISDELSKNISTPYAFFGHSMGALVAFEVARNISRQNINTPFTLVLSGRNGPGAQANFPSISHYPDDLFLNEISKRYGMLPKEVIVQEEMRDIFLPILRNDFALVESYVFVSEPQLSIPLFVYFGKDDQFVEKDLVGDWKNVTESRVIEREFLDGHFYLETQREPLLKHLFHDLRVSAPINSQAPVNTIRSP